MEKNKQRTKSEIGKKNKRDGAKFETSVRKYLESEGWTVSKWQNNIEWEQYASDGFDGKDNSNLRKGKIVPAKRKYNPFNKVLTIGTGFPDFICFRRAEIKPSISELDFEKSLVKVDVSIGLGLLEPKIHSNSSYLVMGVEAKSNGTLDKEEKEKIAWLLKNNIFSKILIAKKGEGKGKIDFIEMEIKKDEKKHL
jgi:hypothetical protein